VDEKLPTKISGHVHCLNENPFLLAFEAKKIVGGQQSNAKQWFLPTAQK
jgi:hypothetical protein